MRAGLDALNILLRNFLAGVSHLIFPAQSMKKTLALLTALVVVAQSTMAFTLDDLVGTWKGVRLRTANGETLEQPTTFVYRKFQGTGLIERSTTKVTAGTNRGVRKFFSDGTEQFIGTSNGEVSGLWSGYWSFGRHDSLTYRESSQTSSRYGTTTIRFVSKDKFVLAIKFSDGVKVIGQFIRQ